MIRRAALLLMLITLPALAKPPKKASAPAPAAEEAPPELIHFKKSTPDEDKAAIAAAHEESGKISDTVGVIFTEIQTDHFIISTDWDPREHAFLKRNVELAYTAVARQFDLLPKDNVFVGKLPIYMFAHHADFTKFAQEVDHFDAPKLVDGYFANRSDGWLHMAMWKPIIDERNPTIEKAERDWAYTLTHEFTHAFMARYHSNARLPRWLDEGVAEVVANSQFPREWATAYAKFMSGSPEVKMLFDDNRMPSGDMYPVMMTMVQSLIGEGPKGFLKYVNDIKEGTDPEKALQKQYHVDNDGLLGAWHVYIDRLKVNENYRFK